MFFTKRIKHFMDKIINYLKEVFEESKKVTWPTPKQTLASTAVVIIIVFIVSIYLGIVDFVLAKLVKFVLG